MGHRSLLGKQAKRRKQAAKVDHSILGLMFFVLGINSLHRLNALERDVLWVIPD
jgi:hypothetical protein